MEFLLPIVIPAFLSLLIKLFLLFGSRNSKLTSSFTMLLYICMLQSLCEVVTFFSYLGGNDVEILFRAYYVFLIWWVGFSFIYTSEVISLPRGFSYVTCTIATILTIMLLFTDTILSGYYSIGYSITAVKAKFYGAYQFYIIGLITTSMVLLLKQVFKKEQSSEIQIKSLYLFIGFAAPFATIFIVTVLMQLGYKINMLMVLPIATAIFVIFVVKSESNHRLTDIRRLLPGSLERNVSNDLMNIMDNYTLHKISYKDAVKELETTLVNYSTDKSLNNISKTAEFMQSPRATVYAIRRRLDMKTMKEIKKTK